MDSTLMKKLLLAALVALLPLTAQAQLYPLFGPVTGIMKGNSASPQTTAAVSSDVIGLWSGCTGTNFLRGDGTCSTPGGTGVALTAIDPIIVTGSPGTSLALSWSSHSANAVFATPNGSAGAPSIRVLVGADIPPINVGSTANGGVLSTSILLGTNGGTSNGFFSVTGPATALRTFTFPNASATVLTDNALVTVAQGGTGVGTLTGLIKGNGTSAFSAATSANVISLFSGTCSSTTFLRGDGACASAGGGAVGGSTTQIQYNNAGVFGGTSNVTFNNSTLTTTYGSTGATNPNIIWDSFGSAYNEAFIAPTQQQFIYTVLGPPVIAGSPKNGPGIQARWDGGTANRYMAIGTFDGTGTWAETVRFQNGQSIFSAATNGGTIIANALTTNQGIEVRGPTTGVTSVAYITFADSAAARNGYIGCPGLAGGDCVVESDHQNINMIPLSSTGRLRLTYDGGATYFSVPQGASRIVSFVINGVGGCTNITLNGASTSGCSRTGVGSYSLTPSPALPNGVPCTASPTSNTQGGVTETVEISEASSGITVVVKNTVTAAAVDDVFSVICTAG